VADDDLKSPERRRFLACLAGAAAATALACQDRRAPPPATPPPATPPPVLNDSVRATLAAMTERILPSDDGPGAREADVVTFIARELQGELAAIRPLLVQLCTGLDSAARGRFGYGFAALGAAEKDALLGELARGELAGARGAQVFETVHTLTLEGFLSAPVHGGNRNEVGWQAISFSPPHLHSRLHSMHVH
jgi:gluconate 2-dehydrogenase gamma chain